MAKVYLLMKLSFPYKTCCNQTIKHWIIKFELRSVEEFVQQRQISYQNRMESGTILHLALLRKISSRQSQHQSHNGFYQTRINNSRNTSRIPCTFQTSRQLGIKNSPGERIHFIKNKSKSFEQTTHFQETQNIFQVQSHKLSGWDIQNEEDHYQTTLKLNDFTLFKKQLMKIKKVAKNCNQITSTKESTRCDPKFKSFFGQFKLLSSKQLIDFEQPKTQRGKKLKPLIINSRNRKQYLDENKNSQCFGKQNNLCEDFVARSSVRKTRQNFKDRIQRLNEYAKEFGDQLLRKRVY